MAKKGKREMLPAEGAKSTMRVMLARAVASALVLGMDECAEDGKPLTQKQRVKLVEMALMSAADVVGEAEQSIDAEALIDGLVRPRGEA